MKKAIQIAYNNSFEKVCKIAHESGFEYISVNYSELIGKTEAEWNKVTEDIVRIMEENELKCVQSHPYYYDLLMSSEITKPEFEFAIKQAIKSSGKIGAPWCALHPRSSVSTGYRKSKSFEDNKKVFSEYLEYAHKYNTGIAVENLPTFPGMVPITPFYSSDYDDLCTLVDSFNDERVGICWDTGHANLMCFNQAEAIKFLGKRIKCTHLHNNFHHEDLHLTPDVGNIPWDNVMDAFAQVEYSGPLTLETHCLYNDDDLFASFIRHNYICLIYLEKLMGGLKK